MTRAPGERRSLSHVGGATTIEGDAALAERLAAALSVPASSEAEDLARAHVHGFHSYPARMHPLTARRLVDAFSTSGALVLDPFAGSGTVLVEARLAGRGVAGVDANPLAVRLARLKVTAWTVRQREAWVDAARDVAAFADARRKARSGATRRYGPEDVAMFAPHTLLEVDGLRAGIDRVPVDETRAALELVLSAILTKVSRRGGDTSELEAEKRIAAGYPARLFFRKTEELAGRVGEIARALAAARGQARVVEGDARELGGIADGSVDLVVTSPPYPGNYDYLAHHAARLRWLRLPADAFDQAEIGARRRLDPLGAAAVERWRAEVSASLGALRRVLRASGSAVLLFADSVVAGSPVYAVDLLRSLAPGSGFEVRAVASQARPHFHAPTARAFARRPRAEHAILLARAPAPSPDAARERSPDAARERSPDAARER